MPAPDRSARAVRAAAGTAAAMTAWLACSPNPSGMGEGTAEDSGRSVTLAGETRPALPDRAAGRWRIGAVLASGHLVLAAGHDEADAHAAWSLTATLEHEDGSHPLTSFGAGSGERGWVERIVPVPEELVGSEGRLLLELEHRGAGRPTVARPTLVPADPRRPNFVLLSIDTLRADALGCYGNARATSPAIDRMAEAGVRCRKVIAPSNWTLPSHYSMMTSLYPSVHGVNPDRALFGGFRRPTQVLGVRGSGRETTLAERLSELGYFTAAITENGWVHPEFGFDQGFASYVADTSGSLAVTGERTLEWLRQHSDLPFFLFVHTYQPHQPYDQPPPYDTMFLDPGHLGYAAPGATVPVHVLEDFQPGFFEPTKADVEAFRSLYDGEVRYVDDFMADVIRTLRSESLDDRTVVVLTSDHGEEIFEHGRFSHGDALYDEVMQVPLILWGAGIPAGVEIAEAVSLLDILPTVVEIAGGAVDGPVQGMSLVPRFAGGAASPEPRMLFAEGFGKDSVPMYGIWRGSDKYIAGASPSDDELYDLVADPGERDDLSRSRPETAAELRAAIQRWLDDNRNLGKRFEAREGEIDEAVVDRLRALGYVD